jgi:hypothetical protein
LTRLRAVRRFALVMTVAAAVVALAAACGDSKKPKVDAAAERAAATERTKQGAFGDQVKALETAKGIEADVNRKAQESVDKIEKDAR